MSKPPITAMILVALATVAISYVLNRAEIAAARPIETPTVGRSTQSGEVDIPSRAEPAQYDAAAAETMHEPLPDGDTTGRLRESLTLDDLLDEVDADAGEGFTPVDRERLAAELASDPVLRKALGK